MKNGSLTFKHNESNKDFSRCLPLFSFNSVAQNTIEAKVKNWEYGAAKIGVLDFVPGEIQKFGSIDTKGTIEIQLESDFLEQMKQATRKRQRAGRHL